MLNHPSDYIDRDQSVTTKPCHQYLGLVFAGYNVNNSFFSAAVNLFAIVDH